MIDLGVALMPDEKVGKLCIELSQLLQGKYKTSYNLDGKKFHPHMTLYQSTFRRCEDLENAMGKIKNLGKCLGETDIELEDIAVTMGRFVFLNCFKTKSLQKFHEDILELAADIWMKDTPTICQRNKVALSKEQEESDIKYGYPNTHKLFNPHFTIGRLAGIALDSDNKKIIFMLRQHIAKYKNYKFSPAAIAIYEVGTDGGCMNPKNIH